MQRNMKKLLSILFLLFIIYTQATTSCFQSGDENGFGCLLNNMEHVFIIALLILAIMWIMFVSKDMQKNTRKH